jgi:purine-nucleoside phosphorylase
MVKLLGVPLCGNVHRSEVGASHGLETFGVSVITDMGDEDSIETISHDEVLEAQKAEPKVGTPN